MNQAIAAVMAKYKLTNDALRADGRLTLAIDGAYRVHLIPANNGAAVIESKVRSLPDDKNDAEQCIDNALRLAAGRLRESGCTLTLDRDRQNLLLQQQVRADASPKDVEELLGAFVNEIAWWRKVA